MNNLNFDQVEVTSLDRKEVEDTVGGSTPWDAIIENLGEIVDTAAGFIDGLLGRHK